MSRASGLRLELPASESARRAFAAAGVPLESDAVTTPEGETDLDRWLDSVPPELADNAVLMDATTIAAVDALSSSEGSSWLTPLTLWDLATFATAVVLNDRVFVMANRGVDYGAVNARLGHDVLTPIRVPPPIDEKGLLGAAGVVQGLWTDADTCIRDLTGAAGKDTIHGRELEAVRRGWEGVLGTPITVDDLFDSTERRSWSGPAWPLLHELADAVSPARQTADLDLPGPHRRAPHESASERAQRMRVLISECNRRSYFNQRLTDLFELPYMPNAARLPFGQHQYRRSVAVQARIDQVIQGQYVEIAQDVADVYSLPGEANVTLPVTLAAAVARVSRPEEILDCLGELRLKGEAFRRRRAELDAAIRTRNGKVAAELRVALEQDQQLWKGMLGFGPVVGAAGATLSLLAGGPFSLVLGGMSVLLGGAAAIPEDVRRPLVWRLLRPQFRFVSELGESARQVTDAMPKISSLWGIPDEMQRPFAERIAALGTLEPKPGRLNSSASTRPEPQ